MSLLRRLLDTYRRRPSPTPATPPAPLLAPTPLFTAPLPPPHPDMALIQRAWNLHLRHHPGMTWPEFLEILEGRHRFFREERVEREAKLRRLLQTPRYTP